MATRTPPSRGRLYGHLAMALQTLLTGPAYSFVNQASREFDSYNLMLFRSLGAALVFTIILLAKELPKGFQKGFHRGFRPNAQERRDFFVITLLGMLFNQSLYLVGIGMTTPANGALIYSLTPLVVLLIAVLVTRSERITPLKLLAIAIAVLGAVLVFASSGERANPRYLNGNLIMLLAVFCWSGYMVYSRRLLGKYSALQLTAVMLILGALLYLPVGLLMLHRFQPAEISPQGWFGLGYAIAVNSVLSFSLIAYALSQLRASLVAVYMNLQPVVATLFSVFYTGERLTLLFVLGGCCTLGGLFLLNRVQAQLNKSRSKSS